MEWGRQVTDSQELVGEGGLSLLWAQDKYLFPGQWEGRPWVSGRPRFSSSASLVLTTPSKDTGPSQECGTGPQLGLQPLGAEVLNFSQTPNWKAADSRNLSHSRLAR